MTTFFRRVRGSSDGPLSSFHRKGRGEYFSCPLSLHPPSTTLSASPLSLTISTSPVLSSFYPAVCDPHTLLLPQSGRRYHSRLDLAPSIRSPPFPSPPSTRTFKRNVLDTECLTKPGALPGAEPIVLSCRVPVSEARVIGRRDTM